MLAFLAILMMLILAYCYWAEGLFTAASMCVNVVLAGIIAFNFWEPLASELDVLARGSILSGYEDFLVLIGLFTISLSLLRLFTNNLCHKQVVYLGYVQQVGGAIFGLATGFFTAGFFVCALQTLPWHENFVHFEPRGPNEVGLRRILPPDRVWLAMMRYAGAHPLSWTEVDKDADSPYDRWATFDRHGTFEIRYLRYRRYGDKRAPLDYQGEFYRELQK